MSEQSKKIPCCTGLLAHVDAGKTTLCEALLYCSGARRTLGRVDHRDAFLDTHALERERGITIFSKQALLSTENRSITLLDTPGHGDFSPEAERVMPILDCAVLVISATDGIQAHTLTLWNLLERYRVPVFLFLNKTDLPGPGTDALMHQLQTRLSAGCVNFDQPEDALAESIAMCDETILERYLEGAAIAKEEIASLIAQRRLFPCCFGSALHLQGIDALLSLLDSYAPHARCGEDFGAQVYKISRDDQGNRLTWLRLTGGTLRVRDPIVYRTLHQQTLTEKAVQLRLYSGSKFTAADAVFPGQLCAVTGLSATYAGQSLGASPPVQTPVLEPVMIYGVTLPPGTDPMAAFEKLRQLQEEEPQLQITWDSHHKKIRLRSMGAIALEVLRAQIQQRFHMDVTLEPGQIFYKETIAASVEGVGHYEPLRHYAEVHLLLEPLARGSGLAFDSRCPSDVLDTHYQNLVLTHLREKTHLGVLTGFPITDMKITLLLGKAHEKHTEGGDFRQATYRAVRQGLMQAKSVLLEPWYDFTVTAPSSCIGRAITDIRAMGGELRPPVTNGDSACLSGTVPAAQIGGYGDRLAAYTRGMGHLQLTLRGYDVCHNPESVIASIGYDPTRDPDNTPDSVFCDHGAGVTVKWDAVKDHMHLESGRKPEAPRIITSHLRMDDQTLEAIMEREFGPVKRPVIHTPENRPARESLTIRPPRKSALIVDGYNIIFAWPSLAALAKADLDAARRRLCDILSSYAGFRQCYLVVVFDGYKVPDNPGEKLRFHNIHVVYTRHGQTADAYMEALAADIGKNYDVRVATSDALVQLSALRSGVLRLSARELEQEILSSGAEMEKYFKS